VEWDLDFAEAGSALGGGHAEAKFQDFLVRLGVGIADFEHFFELMRGWGMRTSARNELAGKVKSVTLGAVDAEVVLDIGGGDELVAIITTASVENLALQPGGTAYALVKAPWVVLTTGETIKTSARNRLCGKVEMVEQGTVNAEVTLTLPGGKRITAIVTNDSVRELGLRPGVRACALIKASHVIVAVNA
jgi:molybdate transport system regulatory protein